MEIKKAIEVLNAELQHTKHHIQFENKAKEYYEEMQDIIDDTEMAISALEKQVGKKPLQACGHATELFKRDIPLMEYFARYAGRESTGRSERRMTNEQEIYY